MDLESVIYNNPIKEESWKTVLTLAYQSLGVVYGDLSTSPLYVYKSTFAEDIKHSETNEEIYGVLSFVFWTLTLIPLLKYVFIVLRADDNGEGGTFALYSLICRHARVSLLPNNQLADEDLTQYTIDGSTVPVNNNNVGSAFKTLLEKHRILQRVLLVLALIGTCMVIGDGVLTPAISVFSAVSGLELSMSKEQHKYVEVPVACIILLFLFSLQHYGTHRVGFLFAPIVLTWLLCISAIGVYNIFHWNPHVYEALSPYYMFKFLKKTQEAGWMSLGGILLCITGSEAMFADLGHFSQLSIKIAFTLLVYPSLILAYMGQAAYLSKHHYIENDYQIGFYVSVPVKLRWPVLVIAILQAVVGSQAIITGTFSIIKQCSSLGCFPKVKIVHTSSKMHGQIYIPEINWSLMLLCLAITIGFRDTKRMGNAAEIVTGVVSNLVSALIKRLWSLKSPPKPVQHIRSMMKFESGYNVDTIFDGSKLGIEPHSIQISPNGEYLLLDSENSNIYEISTPITRYSRPKLVAGSAEGYIGHIDGRPREARMNHPKGLTVDDRGNIYIADTMNVAIRKITDEGMTTIAGGKWGQVGGHVDGAGEDAKFSNDFDVIYVSSSCSLLVVDRGNQAIREIQLHQDDCTTYEYDINMPLGIAVLVAAGFFGYMLALLQWRVRALFSSPDDPRGPPLRKGTEYAAQQRACKSVRPPLIPSEDEEYEKSDESFFVSLGRLFVNSGSSMAEILGGLFSGGSKRKPLQYQYHHQQQQQYQNQFSNRHHHHHHHPNSLPMQESFVIPDEDEPPPPLETRKAYPFMSNNEIEKPQQFKRTRAYLNGWDGDYNEQKQQQQQQHRPKVQQQQQQQLHQLHTTRYSSTPQSYYEESRETNEIVFGAVQEHDGRREAMVIKAVDYGDPKYSNNNIRPRLNYVGYSNGY